MQYNCFVGQRKTPAHFKRNRGLKIFVVIFICLEFVEPEPDLLELNLQVFDW